MTLSLILKTMPGRLAFIGFALVVLMFSASVIVAQETPTPIPADEVAEEIVDFTTDTAQVTVGAVENFINNLTQTPKSDIARILLVAGGLILLLGGWRIYESIILIAGFLIGAAIAVSLLATDNTLITIAAILLGGLIGTVLSVFLYYAAVFVIGAYIGIVLTNGLAVLLSLAPVSSLVLLIGGLIGGFVLLGLSFEFLILLSAVVGAQMLSLGLGLSVVWTLVFAVIGIILQLGMTRFYNYDFRRRPRRINFFRRVTT